MNEILFFVTLLVSLTCVVVIYKFYGKQGLSGWIIFASVVANIEVVKCIDLFGLSVTLGNVLYGSTFLATDILTEIYGGRSSRKAVRGGFYALITFTVLMQLSLAFKPNEADFVGDAMHTVFSLTPRVCIASLAAYLISNTLDTYIYEWMGNHTKKIWIKNNASTMISQALDTVLFTYGAFLGIFAEDILLELIFTTYAIKFLVALCDTPFLYWARQLSKG